MGNGWHTLAPPWAKAKARWWARRGTPWQHIWQAKAHRWAMLGNGWHTLAPPLASGGTSVGNVEQWVAHVGTTHNGQAKTHHLPQRWARCPTVGKVWHHHGHTLAAHWACQGTSKAKAWHKLWARAHVGTTLGMPRNLGGLGVAPTVGTAWHTMAAPWACQGTSVGKAWHQRWAQRGTRWHHLGHGGQGVAHHGRTLAPPWAHIGTPWAHIGTPWAHVGTTMGAHWHTMGARWHYHGRRLAHDGRTAGPPWPSSGK